MEYWTPTLRDMLFSFLGRIGRFEYIVFIFMVVIIFLALSKFAYAILTAVESDQLHEHLFLVVLIVLPMLFAWPILALTSKRLQDLNSSGWFSILAFVPGVSFVQMLFLVFRKGDSEKNRYGYPSYETLLKIYPEKCPKCDSEYRGLEKLFPQNMCDNCWGDKSNREIIEQG